MHSLPPCWTQPLPKPNEHSSRQAAERQQTLTKPPGSLGQLEQLAIRLAGLQGVEQPTVDPVRITVFAGDHGVCEEGVSAFPQEVTAQMIANFADGGAAISVLAGHLNASLEVVNLGTVGEVPVLPGVLDQQIATGTANLAVTDAMTEAQACAALASGDAAAGRAAHAGCRLFIGGDMGIGNTTSAAALACALLNRSPEALVGPGTGLDTAGISHKSAVVSRALKRHGDNTDPLMVLASLGGFEIAALTGAILGCAARGIPVLVDGFIVSVAALVAVRQQPDLREWLVFAHRSAEPGHQAVLEALDAKPLLDLGMRLGEGSGAAVAVPLLRAACELHNRMASFADAGVSDRDQGESREGSP
ncbi:nicotinate-nucleotide--dimethylbenzimidazole phosphoribosyltransferase [Marinobacter sp. SS13-12]|uniref:nicotinate-nucleotide--dimethylbenzimidazole phosphoribosyltransferase n=1 Tax=Marinobacter sp. SS13-12 TaxID=3050451 RepID=UPI002554073A|nr:nicotinate-nucleotide--dimethylbenzimidazole phosphoribosyltransferase [Marinobacter sp. SS13-12]MDK8462177.1 nicotinate-nucleotide--dimethylbenzimidazole phosphoribosyltransferase [Marinobacter sp. SS13-12]